MIVATAGHIDHGKTRLIGALTGVDTDRLPEERLRGISIDLGFAYLPLEAGGEIGFVDVPGHERFIHNMLAGVCGIDFALLVVAADDGVMPQTREHLQILDLLGIEQGLVVLTKIDRVDDARRKAVTEELGALLRATRLAGAAIIPASTISGEGIPAVRAALIDAARMRPARYRDGELFRLSVDRAFSVAGAGTVVTGTVFNGAVVPGDALVVSPDGAAVRVRGVQVRGKPAAEVKAGTRCALNLAGAEVADVKRGDWVLAEALHAPTSRLEVGLELLPEGAQLAHWQRVHLHLATAEVMARVSIRGGGRIAAAAKGRAQLILEQPIGALAGDRFILRDQAARRTLGGGRVIDPFAAPSRRISSVRAAELAALELGEPEAALPALLRIPGYAIDCGRFERAFCLSRDRAESVYRKAGAVRLGRETHVVIRAQDAAMLRTSVQERLAGFHAAEPHAPGMEIKLLRNELAPWLGSDAFGFLLRSLADARTIELDGTLLKVAGFDATSNPHDEALWKRVQTELLEAGYSVPRVGELAKKLGVEEGALLDFMHRKAKTGAVFRISESHFYPKATLAILASNAALVARHASRGLFSAAQYRDANGINRGLAIEILEFFDNLGITQRIGDLRKMHKNFVPVLGAAKPNLVRKPAPSRHVSKRR